MSPLTLKTAEIVGLQEVDSSVSLDECVTDFKEHKANAETIPGLLSTLVVSSEIDTERAATKRVHSGLHPTELSNIGLETQNVATSPCFETVNAFTDCIQNEKVDHACHIVKRRNKLSTYRIKDTSESRITYPLFIAT